jgi:hypothetical protein
MDPTVKWILDWLSRGGVAAVVYFVLTSLQVQIVWLKDDIMFWFTCLLTAIAGFGVWHFGMWMGYVVTPGPTPQEWVAVGGAFIITIFMGSQFIYSGLQLRLKRVDPVAYAAKYNKQIGE